MYHAGSGAGLGVYCPGESWAHRLDPRTKMLAALAYAVTLFATVSTAGLALLAAALAVGLAASGISWALLWRFVRPLLPLVLFVVILQLIARSGTAYWQVGPLAIHHESAWAGAILAARLLLLALSGLLLVFTTSPVLMADAIARLLAPLAWLRLPVYDLALMITLALRFVPQLLLELQQIIKAQAARGADPGRGGPIRRLRHLIPVLVPLLATGFRRADELAVAMESRCWRGGRHRTRRCRLGFSRADAGFAAGLIILMAAVLLVSRAGY